MFKYLYEKDYKNGNYPERILFDSAGELFIYLLQEDEKVFNAGFTSAEIKLSRIKMNEGK